MADFRPFDLGQVIQTAETIKGMRRQENTDRLRDVFLGEQIQNAQLQREHASAQAQRAETQFSQEQQIENTKLMNAAASEVAVNPAAAERWMPQLQKAGVISPNIDWRQIPPDQLQAAAKELQASTGAALQALVSPDSRFTAEQNRQGRAETFSNQKELAAIQHKYGMEEISARGRVDAEKAANMDERRTFKDIQSLRKEFEGMDAVKNYRGVLPQYQRAKNAPDTRAGDLSIIYALGKIFDPTSVVRGEELILAKDAQPWLQKIVAEAQSQITSRGALTPDMRKDIMQAMEGQVLAFKAPYDQERQRYSGYAQENGWTPDKIVGASSPGDAFGTGNGAQFAEGITATGPNGQKIVLRNGQWVAQ